MRQLTDGVNFIQMIYNANLELQDCEFLKEQNHVDDFLTTFKQDVEKAQNFDVFDDEDHEEDEGDIERYFGNDLNELRNVSFEVVGERLPKDLEEWMDFGKLKTECKVNHQFLKKMLHFREHGSDDEKEVADSHFERYVFRFVYFNLNIQLVWPNHCF